MLGVGVIVATPVCRGPVVGTLGRQVPASRRPCVRQPRPMGIRVLSGAGVASFGTVTVRTPSLCTALTPARSASPGSWKLRRKRP